MDAYVGDDFYCHVAIPRQQPIDVVHEDADILAFHHTRPFWPVHVVVVPKRHVGSLLALTTDEAPLAARLLATVQQVAAEIEREHGAASIVTNLGGYQDSKHLHVHVRFGEPLRGHGGKLVRDRVPERIRDAGGSLTAARVGDAEYREALRAKLVEEAQEVAAAVGRDALLDELADVDEVLHAIREAQHIDLDAVRSRAEAKRATHGGFERRLVSIAFEAPPDAQVLGASGRPRRRAAAASPRQRREQ